MLDSLGSHKGLAVRQAIRGAGVKSFLMSAYSPDMNSIEQVLAKLKTLLRKAAERTTGAVCERIGELLDRFSSEERANYLRTAR